MRDTVERNAESVHGGVMKIADVKQVEINLIDKDAWKTIKSERAIGIVLSLEQRFCSGSRSVDNTGQIYHLLFIVVDLAR